MSIDDNFSTIYFSIFNENVTQTKTPQFLNLNNDLNLKKNQIHNFRRSVPNRKKPLKLEIYSDNIKNNGNNINYRIPKNKEPYKQYLSEKNEVEKIRKRKELEQIYRIELKKLQEAKNEISNKYNDIRRYKKDNINKNGKAIFCCRKNRLNTINFNYLKDLKTNKIKNIFEENFFIDNEIKYEMVKGKTLDFLRYLRKHPNFNYFVRENYMKELNINKKNNKN